MSVCDLNQLKASQCAPCEGGVTPLDPEQARDQLKVLTGWELDGTGRSIRKKWNCKNFLKSLDFCHRVGALAETEGHHPDLHLTGYRHVEIVLTTHAIGGLSINDFILAAKIDGLDGTQSGPVSSSSAAN